jgi:hypothetical protein
VIEAVDAERVLPQPDADELVDEHLVVRQGDPVPADRLVRLSASLPTLAAVNANSCTITPAARASWEFRRGLRVRAQWC